MSGKTIICVAAILVAYAMPVMGADDTHATCNLKVSSQPLDDALQEMARQCDVQVIYFSEITAGLTAPELGGQYAIDDALHLLLDRTGLSFRHLDPRTVEIRRGVGDNSAATAARGTDRAKRNKGRRQRPPPDNQSPLPEVVISGTAEGLVATRIETPLREIPQTISIISSEQMRQQNNFDFNDALDDAVGITTLRRDSFHSAFYSRGFQVLSYTLDGGGALQPFSQPIYQTLLLIPDLSEFDHVEVLRGANALFSGDVLPGGAVNLVRKRPLDMPTAMFTSSAGSWNNYRQEVDITGPLALEGALRGRLDVTYANREYFYKRARDERKSVFGVLDYDLAPGALLTVGGSYGWDRALPFEQGLPLLNDGRDPHLPRSTSFTFDWSRIETQVREAYLRFEEAFGPAWSLKLNATLLSDAMDFAVADFVAPIDAATGGIPTPPYSTYMVGPATQTQFNLEATFTGTEQLLGHRADFAFGADFRRSHGRFLQGGTPFFGPPVANAYQFDPADYPDPRNGPRARLNDRDWNSNTLAGLFASVRVQLMQPWFVTAGLRVSNERVVDDAILYFPGLQFAYPQEYEYNGKVTPYVGTVFAINDVYSLYASYADVFLSNHGAVEAGGNRVSPSDGIDMEAGIKGAWRNGALNGSLALYKIVQRGIGLYDPNATSKSSKCCYTSGGKNISKGLDLELTGSPAPHWLISAGYTLNNNAQVAAGRAFAGSLSQQTPRHLLKLWTSADLPGAWYRWSVGGTVDAQSAIYSDTTSCPVSDVHGKCLSGHRLNRVIQKSYVVVSPRIGYQFDRHWQVALSVTNVFDRRYFQTINGLVSDNWYGEPRSVLVRLDGRY